MRIPQPRTLSLLVAVTIVTVLVSSILWNQSREHRVDADLAESLCSEHGWHCTPYPRGADAAVAHGFFLSLTPRGWDDLATLSRHPQHRLRWQGIVFVEDGGADSLGLETPSWGEYGRTVGSATVYGDPTMVPIVAKAIQDRR